MHRLVARNCGKFGVPGSGVEHDYTGVVEDGSELRGGYSVKFVLSGFQVIEHPFPIFFLGANIFCGG